jgi:chaperonin GroEL
MSNQGYIPKDLTFDSQGRAKLIEGITKISTAVKSTLGPRGKTVLIESPDHLGGITITKDGVTVAKSIFLDDPVENLSIQMMKDAANRTANVAGDGTTTAIVLTEALIKSGNVHITSDLNTTEVIRYINKVSEQVLCMLKKKSVDVDDKRLLDVASIAANNNSEIGEIISKAYEKVGKHGIVTVEKSMTAETYAEVTNGIRVDRGYTSNLFINNQRKDECILEDVQVLVCDTEISNILQIESVLKPIIQQNQKLLIIGECSQNVINTLAANVVRNGLKLCNIIPPNFGYKKHELMQDIAISVGAKYFSESTGDDLSLINSNDLGHADKIIVGKDSSVIIKHNQLTQEIKNRIEELKEQQSNAKQNEEKKFINERIASLSGAIGCIYVGGNSDVEQKEKFDRVDDSVCAVKSALDEGIIAGGGIALWDIADGLGGIAPLDNDKDASKEEKVAYHIMYETIKTPLIQILENAGKDYKKITNEFNKAKHKSKRNFGYDAKNEKYGDMFKLGIIDPLKVTRNALINAVSVATTILSTNAIVTHARVNQQK